VTVPTPTAPAVPLPTEISLALDRVANLSELGRADLDTVMKSLPDNTALWVHVDIVRAIGHLRAASALVDKIADTLEADAVEVAR
jgi:hypothetical protein